MISKGYHYVINVGINSNFYISIDTAYPGSLAKDLLYQVNSGESIIHVEFWQGIIWTAPI